MELQSVMAVPGDPAFITPLKLLAVDPRAPAHHRPDVEKGILDRSNEILSPQGQTRRALTLTRPFHGLSALLELTINTNT